MMLHALRQPGLMALAPALLLLCACGGKEEGAVSDATDSAVEATEVARGMAGAMTGLVSTEGLPAFVEMYKGGTAVMHMRTGEGDKRGGVFTYSTDAPLADVVAFHRESMKKAGIDITTEMSAQDSVSFGGTGKDETLSLLTTIAVGEDGVTVSQTYSQTGG
jgi:hypothetical protein